MSVNVNFHNTVYPVPLQGDKNWGAYTSRYLVALGTYSLTNVGGLFTLTNDINFGPTFGLLSPYFTSTTANPATAGVLRLAKTNTIEWRNNANAADNILAVNGSDQLTYNGGIIATGLNTLADGKIWIGSSGNLPVALTLTGDITVTDLGVTAIGANKIVDSQINSSAAIIYTKLNLAGSITNSDIYSSAGIVYSKLSLSNSIVNADINTAAAIAYSKLALSNSIVNADIASAAAIAYSKLAALTTGKVLISDGSGFVSASTVTTTTLGFLDATSSIQTQLNGKQATLTIGNLSDVGTDGITVTGGTGAVIGSGTSLSQHVADSTHNGYLSSTDWSTFNGKQAAFSGLTTNGVIYATGATAEASTAAGTTGQFLAANTGAAPTWGTPSGSGTVNSGTTPLLAYYKTTTNAVNNVDADASMGSNKITNLKDGTGAQDAAAFGQVKVLQVVSAATTTSTTSTSGTFADATNLTASITPASASNKVLIIADVSVRATSTSTNAALGKLQLVRGASTAVYVQTRSWGTNFGTAQDVWTNITLVFLDSPATTSSTSYKVQFATDSTTTIAVNDSSSSSSITLMEVKP